jgi:hypothetical protein
VDPTGISTFWQETYTFRFRRVVSDFRQRADLFIGMVSSDVGSPETQTLPLTQEELDARKSSVSRFWCGPEDLDLDYATNGEALHSVTLAGRTTEAILDTLLEAGADVSFWTGPETKEELPAPPLPPSALCLSTPLHQAIAVDNHDMLERLLHLGFNPNARALIAGCQAFTPIQHSIRTGNVRAYRRLSAHPLADASILTPAYRFHMLHFAVAHLSIAMLEAIDVPLRESPASALGHTLGHIACMPLDETHIQLFSHKIRGSIHDIRTFHLPRNMSDIMPGVNFALLAEEQYKQVPRISGPDYRGPGDKDASGHRKTWLGARDRHAGPSDYVFFDPPSDEFLGAQAEVMTRIVQELGIKIVLDKDYLGNTPMHYLASARVVNDSLIAWLREHTQGDYCWLKIKNEFGHTPRDLWVDNITLVEPGYPAGYHPSRGL